MVRKRIIACQITVLIYIIYFLPKTAHFYRLVFSRDVKTCRIRLTMGKNKKWD